MPKLPQDYINFIVKGIVHNFGFQGIPLKDDYSEEDLMGIFECNTTEELHKKINDIEESTVAALGLPIRDSYSVEELEEHLNFAPGMLQNMQGAFENFPDFNR